MTSRQAALLSIVALVAGAIGFFISATLHRSSEEDTAQKAAVTIALSQARHVEAALKALDRLGRADPIAAKEALESELKVSLTMLERLEPHVPGETAEAVKEALAKGRQYAHDHGMR